MIHQITSSKPGFKTVHFQSGLNVIYADKAKNAKQTDSRNGTGKTTFIAIIDFCLGGNGDILKIEPLRKYDFTIEITLGKNRIFATRFVEDPNFIYIEGDTDGYDIQPSKKKGTSQPYYTVEEWKLLLGQQLFGTFIDPNSNSPSFRKLISYFIRLEDKAYLDPFKIVPAEKRHITEIALTYLLELGWNVALEWQCFRDSQEANKKAREDFRSRYGSRGELETELINRENELKLQKEKLDTFQVHPQYQKFFDEADDLAAQRREIENDNTTLRRRLKQYRESLRDETPPSSGALEAIYSEVGVVFPDAMKKTLEQAKEFHAALLANRREYLQGEIGYIERQLHENDNTIKGILPRYTELLEILEKYGAVSELTTLREQYSKGLGEVQMLRSRIKEISDAEEMSRTLKIQHADLIRRTEIEKLERNQIWKEHVLQFNRITQHLYGKEGNLTLNIAESGYQFDIEIDRSKSGGIGKMKIFCFDFVLLSHWAKKEGKINFLVHDSVIFDPVDERQRETGIEQMAQLADKLGVQYICTINSDRWPDKDDKYIRLTLDDSDTGGLFGFAFRATPMQKNKKKNDEMPLFPEDNGEEDSEESVESPHEESLCEAISKAQRAARLRRIRGKNKHCRFHCGRQSATMIFKHHAMRPR